MSDPPPPPARSQTHREALHEALRAGFRTARELSAELSLRERDVLEHLAHLERSLDTSDEWLEVEPARCVGCGYTFDDRTRLGKPGRCPRCRATRITLPRFRVSMR